MGCLSDLIMDSKFNEKNIRVKRFLRISSDIDVVKFSSYNSLKNINLLDKITEENEKVVPLFKQKIKQLINKGNLSKPIEIGKGKTCGNPCYAYNKKILFNCPKCNGEVNRDYENGFTLKKRYDRYKDCEVEYKDYNTTKICTRFDFNNNIDKQDVYCSELFKFYDKIDKEKTVHWSMEIQDQVTKEVKTLEKDMPIHYMMINGERFDFPYGINIREFLLINNITFFQSLYNPNDTDQIYMSEDQLRSAKICSIGENFNLYYEDIEEDMGQSCGYYGYGRMHMVYIYQCNECGLKYHVIKTSPFANRDKSKDPK